jgi:hypothetical protein
MIMLLYDDFILLCFIQSQHVRPQDGRWPYSVPQSCLKDRPVLGSPFLGHAGVIGAKLVKITEDRQTGDLGQILDLRHIGGIEQLEQQMQSHRSNTEDDVLRHALEDKWRPNERATFLVDER